LRKWRKHPAVVLEIKPPVLPPLVRRCKGGRDVLLRAPWPQLEGAATGLHRHTDLLRLHRLGEELRGKEMGPQVPVRVNPQKTLANCREDGRLRDRVGVEVMQLHSVVVQERPHEAARWHSKPPLMEGDETENIPRRRSRVSLARGGASTPAAAHRRGDRADHQQQGSPDPPQRWCRKATGHAAE
jgi:hypothetical protein